MLYRENAFNFLKLFAAFSVIIGHATVHFHTNFLWIDSGKGIWFYDRVPLFFILSGFFLYKSYDRIFRENASTKEYFIKRFLRIVPGIYFYLVVTTISFFIFGVLHIEDLNSEFIYWELTSLLLIPVYHANIFEEFGVGVVNGSLWTIPIEVSFYIVLPVFVYLKYIFSFKKMISIVILFALIGMISYKLAGIRFSNFPPPNWYKVLGISIIPNLYYFVVGIFFAEVWGKLKHSTSKVIIALFIYIFCRYIVHTEMDALLMLIDIISIVSLGYMALWFGFNASNVFYKLTNKLGDLSYGIYIWHMVVINYFLFWHIDEKIHGTSLILLVIFITFILGWISWHLIEKPALNFTRYKVNKKNKTFQYPPLNEGETLHK